LGSRRAQRCSDISRLEVHRTKGAIVGVVGHVRRDSVQNWAGLHNDIRHWQRALKNAGAVWLSKNCFFQRVADLALVDVKSSGKLTAAAMVPADRMAHDAFDGSALTIPVVFDALYQ